MRYQVNSEDRVGSNHKSESTAQVEAAKRIKRGDRQVYIYRVTRRSKAMGDYEYTAVPLWETKSAE